MVTPSTNEEMSLMMKAFTNKSSTRNVVLPNPSLADKLISVIKRKFKDGEVSLSLKDPGANLPIFRQALYKDGAAKITKDLCRYGLMPKSVFFLSPSQAGGFSGHQGEVRSVANHMELKTGEMPTLAASASELGRRAARRACDSRRICTILQQRSVKIQCNI